MRWMLPGWAEFGEFDPRAVACRPGVAVMLRVRPRPKAPPPAAPVEATKPIEATTSKASWLPTVKQALEVLTLLVGLIGAVLALLGLSRK